MFKRDSLLTRLLAVVLTIAVAWAASPVAGFGADASDAQGQEVASTGAAAKDADASSSQETASADTGGQSSATDPSSAGSTEDSAPDAADSGSTGSASDGSGSASAAVDAGSDNASDKSSKAVPERAPSAETEDTDSASGTYTFTAHWTNDADSETSYTNSDFNADNPDTWIDISCTANDNSQHKSTLYFNHEKDKKVIEEAKAMLMARNHMTEEEAHRYIQKCSMEGGNNMVETAKMLLTVADARL